MICVRGHKIEPILCRMGWYMGTRYDDGSIRCCITEEFYNTREEAIKRMDRNIRYNINNRYCSRGEGCYKKKSNNYNDDEY
jgi:hypothetical protein